MVSKIRKRANHMGDPLVDAMTRNQWIGMIITLAPIVILCAIKAWTHGLSVVLLDLGGAVLVTLLAFGWILGLAMWAGRIE